MKFDDNDPDPIRFTRSVSEYERQMEELMETRNRSEYHDKCARLRELRQALKDNRRPKGVKEATLREIRALERELGFEGASYNGP